MSKFIKDLQPLASSIEIVHGPESLLGRFFIKAFDHAKLRGVTLSFASFEQLLEINSMNLPTWQPLTPAFDPHRSDLPPDRAFCIVGRNASNEIVYTHALKLYDWSDTNLRAEVESMRLFYARPEQDKPKHEDWKFETCDAEAKTGRVTYGGAIWCRPDFRKGRLSTILPRIVWSYGYTRWNFDYLVGMITQRNVDAGFPRRMGYTDIDSSVTRTHPTDEQGRVRKSRYALVTMTPSELLDGNFTYLIEPVPQVHGTVHVYGA